MFQPLSTLPISKKVVKNLTDGGYLFVEDVTNAIDDVTNKIVSIDVIKNVSRSPISLLSLDHWQAELQYDRFTTFSEALNNILDGGIQCGIITEVCGPSGSGKTQLCFQISVTVQLSVDNGGLVGRSLYIDTRNTFSTQRIRDMIAGCQQQCRHINFDRKAMEENITVVSPGTSEELLLLVNKLKNYIRSSLNYTPIRVIVIDSLAFPIVSITDSSEKISYYLKILDELQKLASKYNIAVVIVNEMGTQVDSNGEINFESAGGHVVASRCNKGLMLARISNSKFAARLTKSATMFQVSVLFNITEEGIRDEIDGN